MTINKIKEARQKAGLNQKQLAEMLEVSPSTLSEYEKGFHEPKSDILSKIADICDVSVDFLLCREENKKTPPAPAGPEQEERLTKYEVEGVLIALGLIEDGQHISDRDRDVVSYVISILDAWFEEKRQRR